MEARRMKTSAALTAAILAAGLAFAPLPASAAPPAVDALQVAVIPAAVVPPPADSYDGGILDTYSRALFWFNRQVYNGLNAVTDALAGGKPDAPVGETGLSGPARTAIGRGVGNMASNLVNEPVTALASAASGDFAGAANAVGRFGVNTTVGLLGWNDVAADWGLEPKITDIGLVMCQAGVGEGGYVVLPFIGPRTVRDAVADVVLVNAVLWTAVGASLGTGASWRTIAIAEAVEIVADIVATRQIDPNAKVVHFDDYEAVRKAYLEQRRIRCEGAGKG
jgi:phospholipid-binding lipoprotein MlaA